MELKDITTKMSQIKEPSKESIKAQIYYNFGRNIHDAILAGELRLVDLNGYESHALSFYKHQTNQTWDERQEEEINRLANELPKSIIFPQNTKDE